MDFQIGVHAVRFARQQRLDLLFGRLAVKRLDRGFGLADHPLILLGLAEFDQFDIVGKLTLHARNLLDPRFEIGALAHQFLRGVGIVPKAWIFGERVQFPEAICGCIPVKDASSAARLTA
jgi:hypothetical protein